MDALPERTEGSKDGGRTGGRTAGAVGSVLLTHLVREAGFEPAAGAFPAEPPGAEAIEMEGSRSWSHRGVSVAGAAPTSCPAETGPVTVRWLSRDQRFALNPASCVRV